MTPGQMELMRIPSLPYPAASVLESPSTPALVIAYNVHVSQYRIETPKGR